MPDMKEKEEKWIRSPKLHEVGGGGEGALGAPNPKLYEIVEEGSPSPKLHETVGGCQWGSTLSPTPSSSPYIAPQSVLGLKRTLIFKKIKKFFQIFSICFFNENFVHKFEENFSAGAFMKNFGLQKLKNFF